MNRILAVLLLFSLAGCVADQQNRFHADPAPIVIQPATPASPPEVSKTDFDKLHSETVASSNQAQQSISGLGANIAKLAEKVTGIEGDVSAVKASIATTLTSNVDLRARLDSKVDAAVLAQFKAEITTELRAEVRAELRAEFDAKLESQATALAGWQNTVEKKTETLTAGRDATSIVSFTKEMQSTLESSYDAMMYQIKCAFWAIVGITQLYTLLIAKLMHDALQHERKRGCQTPLPTK